MATPDWKIYNDHEVSLIAKLKKYRVPVYVEYGHSGEVIHTCYPSPAYERNENLRWVRRKCPKLYYKLTGECEKRPMGYGWDRSRMKVKQRLRPFQDVTKLVVYAEFWGSHDGISQNSS